MPLRLVFMGTPDFAVPTLLEIVGSGHEIVAVYTRAQQPAGRGMAPRESAVAHEAERFGLPIFTPKTLRDRDAAEAMRAHGADAAVAPGMDETAVFAAQRLVHKGVGVNGGDQIFGRVEGGGGAGQSGDHQAVPVGQNLVVAARLGTLFA